MSDEMYEKCWGQTWDFVDSDFTVGKESGGWFEKAGQCHIVVDDHTLKGWQFRTPSRRDQYHLFTLLLGELDVPADAGSECACFADGQLLLTCGVLQTICGLCARCSRAGW